MIIQGDCLERLKNMADQSVHCCVTSPPYYNLRDYGMDGQIGQEDTPELYIERLVSVFREVQRVLRDDGTLWVNIGDSYSGSGKGACKYPKSSVGTKQSTNKGTFAQNIGKTKPIGVYKPKDLIGIPWMLAFALRADGWYLRQDIIWHKPNPMPESVTDRCTKSHEYIFLLSKEPAYYFDHEAIQEESVYQPGGREDKKRGEFGGKYSGIQHISDSFRAIRSCRNKRDVWTVAKGQYPGAHFATFPLKLIEPCVLAGCPPGGIVLDPFLGSGTVGEVAIANSREFIGIELNPDYVELAKERTGSVQIKMVN